MRLNEIQSRLRRHPFVPIRVFVSDGSHYDVHHPDFMLLSRAEVVIGLDLGNDQFPERNAYIDPVHITRVEPISGRRSRGRGGKSRG